MDQNSMNEALGLGHLSATKYLVGFALAVLLTIVSFGLASVQGIPRSSALPGLFIAAILQMLVHLHFFLFYIWTALQNSAGILSPWFSRSC